MKWGLLVVLSALSGMIDCQVGIFPKEIKAILSLFGVALSDYRNAGGKRVGWSCLLCLRGLWPQTVHSRGVCPRGALSLNVRRAPCVHKISSPRWGMFTQLKSNSGGLSLPPRWGPSGSHLGCVIDPISDIAGLISARRGVGGLHVSFTIWRRELRSAFKFMVILDRPCLPSCKYFLAQSS